MKEWAWAARTTSTASGMSAPTTRRGRPSTTSGTPAARAAVVSWSSSSSPMTERLCPFSPRSRNIWAPNQRDPISAMRILLPLPEHMRRSDASKTACRRFLSAAGRGVKPVKAEPAPGSTAWHIPPSTPVVFASRFRAKARKAPQEQITEETAMRSVLYALLAGAAALGATAASAQTVLKASHQFPGGKGDPRDEMVQIIAREAKAANVGLEVQVYPGASLFKPNDQWNAIVNGQLDITSFPLDYASGKVGAFSATLMPALVRNHERAQRLNQSDFMKEIKAKIDKAGAVVLADAWLAGAVASKKGCIRKPEDIKGQKVRSAGPTFAAMWQQAGASIVNIPSNEVYNALQTGVAEATDTSTGSFVSFRIYEQVKCVTAPGDNALWFMYEPVLM